MYETGYESGEGWMLSIGARVLQLLRRTSHPLSKAELAEETGVSLSAVSLHIDRLIQAGIIDIAQIGLSTGGRKPRQYSINKNYGFILAIELGTTNVQVAFTNFDCEIVALRSSAIHIQDGPEQVLAYIYETAETLLKDLQLDRGLIRGIGIGLPGPVDFQMGTPVSPPMMPGWGGYPIKQFWARYYDCPCYVDNDVNIMAIGEHAKGLNFEVDHMVYVNVENGIGSGIIYDGVLYRGASGSAGDIGHFDTGADVLCWCGNRGCLEAAAGGQALLSQGLELAHSGRSVYLQEALRARGALTLEDIGLGLQQQEPGIVEMVRESGAQIGRVIASIVNFANPSLVVLGGKVADFGDLFLAAIRQSVYQRSLPLATRQLRINESVLGAHAGIIGGAIMTIDQLILQEMSMDT